ncbi:hypothetical protein P43SY_002761 [Pythium insidiosum]|uniref:BART domain-containing protein n=1 Tax=Pythium insidiosum TaxID=114742 RepID=A0AAD5LRQ9_PYTIN|nr:hypothetical protein P43SY_002761 [Pythium insidiosum]
MPKNIIQRAAEFCASPKFERVFDDFARLQDVVTSPEWYRYKELHDKYLELFEAELSDFVESEGSTVDEFFRECRDIAEGNHTALFEEHKYAWFVEHLLACMDYKHFYGLMVNEARGSGQLGLGDDEDVATPRELLPPVPAVSHATDSFTFGETTQSDNLDQQCPTTRRLPMSQRDWRCHASGRHGELGLGASVQTAHEPTSLAPLPRSHGQLGLGRFEGVHAPTPVPFSDKVEAIACGSEHALVLTEQGELYSCGWGEHGNLGHGDQENRCLLTRVEFFAARGLRVQSVAAGGAVSIAVTS